MCAGADIVRGESSFTDPVCNTVFRSPNNSFGIVGICGNIRKRQFSINSGRTYVTVEQSGHLSARTGEIGTKQTRAESCRDSVCCCPLNSIPIVGIRWDIIKSRYSVGDNRASGHAPEESNDLRTGTGIVRAECIGACSACDTTVNCPRNCVIVVCAAADIGKAKHRKFWLRRGASGLYCGTAGTSAATAIAAASGRNYAGFLVTTDRANALLLSVCGCGGRNRSAHSPKLCGTVPAGSFSSVKISL